MRPGDNHIECGNLSSQPEGEVGCVTENLGSEYL